MDIFFFSPPGIYKTLPESGSGRILLPEILSGEDDDGGGGGGGLP